MQRSIGLRTLGLLLRHNPSALHHDQGIVVPLASTLANGYVGTACGSSGGGGDGGDGGSKNSDNGGDSSDGGDDTMPLLVPDNDDDDDDDDDDNGGSGNQPAHAPEPGLEGTSGGVSGGRMAHHPSVSSAGASSRGRLWDDWKGAGATYVAHVDFIWGVLSEGIGEMNQGSRTAFTLGVKALHAFLVPDLCCFDPQCFGHHHRHQGGAPRPQQQSTAIVI